AVVNADNCLVASAMKLAWEPLFNDWVCVAQRGLLAGRSMLMNFIDVDETSMTVSLREEWGGPVLLDFKAAFPSLSHDYMFAVLDHIGLPPGPLNALKAFDVAAGIRQGCPVSPLLFAVAVDILLRRLERKVAELAARAFVDDIGVVSQNWLRDAGARILAACSDWAPVSFGYHGVYLGFAVGPRKGDSSWDKALKKYAERATTWANVHQGLHIGIFACNVCAVSVLSFLAQLENPPPRVRALETATLRKVAPGPGNWVSKDLWYFREGYGQNRLSMSARGIAFDTIAPSIKLAPSSVEDGPKMERRVRSGFQCEAYKLLKAKSQPGRADPPRDGQDSIEQCIFCRCVRRVADNFLNMRRVAPFAVDHFMLAHRVFSEGAEALTCMAVLLCAVYRTTNQCRPLGGVSENTAFDAMKQQCRNAVAGHSASMRIVDSLWAERPRIRPRR
ncbi:unnamed protein product, partial [Prorocentrum cordatum]